VTAKNLYFSLDSLTFALFDCDLGPVPEAFYRLPVPKFTGGTIINRAVELFTER